MGVRLSVRGKLLATFLALVAVVGGVAFFALQRSLARDLVGSLEQRLEVQARGVAKWIETSRHPEKLAPRLGAVVDARVLIIDGEGVVEGDSAERRVGEHADEPEVAAAREGQVGRDLRSEGGAATLFIAVPGPAGRVVTLSVPMADVEATRASVRDRLLVVSIAGFALALLLGLVAVRAIARPLRAMTADAERLARGEFDIAPPSTAADELGILSRTLAQLAAEVQARIGDLTRQRDLLSAVLGGLVEGVVVLGEDGGVLLVNDAGRDLVGAGGEELAAPGLAPVLARVRDARASGATDVEVVLRGREVLVSARPLPTGRGAVLVLYDVTRLRRLEGVRREFLASAAHELRTPVTAIQGYAETLLGARGELDEATAREFLEVIHRNAQRIGRLVDDLLVLEQIGARPQPLHERAAVELAPVVADVTRTVGAVAERGCVAIVSDIPDGVAVLGDREGLEQVVQNLVDNAIKYGGATVRIGATVAGGKVAIAIADDGPGIPAAHRDQVFERFYRLDPGRARATGGNGLGLAIVKQRVEAMGGKVSVASEPGKGATFTVELDLAP